MSFPTRCSPPFLTCTFLPPSTHFSPFAHLSDDFSGRLRVYTAFPTLCRSSVNRLDRDSCKLVFLPARHSFPSPSTSHSSPRPVTFRFFFSEQVLDVLCFTPCRCFEMRPLFIGCSTRAFEGLLLDANWLPSSLEASATSFAIVSGHTAMFPEGFICDI